ncbi:uncharacterized protein EAF02_001023 [Botrytis sinoallii]|uniref:uncharacterized protein n=1 Tax=Botrytis sinoallii TaxID=1463999 RepID=UPI0018FFF442|nr:uncharacterized protein EAF02_001023 [Botrytis sinoallii]KAF7893485.1 hypothetical protein EAF02_001023 [Botrytis sinoallii]
MRITTSILLALSSMTSLYYSTNIRTAINFISGAGRCSKSYGSLDGVSWVYYATGRNCDTAAEAKTIQKAIKHQLTNGNSPCSTECLDLTRSGAWSGFLLIGPTNSFDGTMYCGPSLSIGSCTSGGKNDL